MEKLKAIFKKIVNKETILYVVFGVLTTLVNFCLLYTSLIFKQYISRIEPFPQITFIF